MKFVIIGNSAAGISAAQTLRRLKSDADITIISEEPHSAYLRCLLWDVLSGEKEIENICYRGDRFYSELGIDLRKGKRVISIYPDRMQIELDNGENLGYDSLLVATGAKHLPLDIENETLENVFTFRSYNHARAARETSEKCKEAVVVGAGMIGLAVAQILNQKGIKTTIVEKSEQLLIDRLDAHCAGIVEQELIKTGIAFVYNKSPEAFIPDSNNETLRAVALRNSVEIPARMAILSAGVKPCTDLVAQAGGRTDVGIVVNDFLQTSLPNVFAAGDCIQVKDKFTGKEMPSVLWPMAVEQGRIAAFNMSEQPRSYFPVQVRMNAAHFGGLPVISAGSINGYDESLLWEDHKRGVCRRFFIKNSRLAGYILIGDVNNAGVCTEIIKKQIVVDHLKDKLLKGNVSSVDLLNLK